MCTTNPWVRKKKDVFIDQLDECRDNGKISKLRDKIEEMRAEIEVNNLALNIELHEIATTSSDSTGSAADSELKKMPSHRKPGSKEQKDGVRSRGVPELNSTCTRTDRSVK